MVIDRNRSTTDGHGNGSVADGHGNSSLANRDGHGSVADRDRHCSTRMKTNSTGDTNSLASSKSESTSVNLNLVVGNNTSKRVGRLINSDLPTVNGDTRKRMHRMAVFLKDSRVSECTNKSSLGLSLREATTSCAGGLNSNVAFFTPWNDSRNTSTREHVYVTRGIGLEIRVERAIFVKHCDRAKVASEALRPLALDTRLISTKNVFLLEPSTTGKKTINLDIEHHGIANSSSTDMCSPGGRPNANSIGFHSLTNTSDKTYTIRNMMAPSFSSRLRINLIILKGVDKTFTDKMVRTMIKRSMASGVHRRSSVDSISININVVISTCASKTSMLLKLCPFTFISKPVLVVPKLDTLERSNRKRRKGKQLA